MDRRKEYAIRYKAVEDLQREMRRAKKKREERKAELLLDSLNMFYSDLGSYGVPSVDLTNPYEKEDYDLARTEALAYLRGGDMPWIKRAPTKGEQAEAKKLEQLKLSLGTPAKRRPLAVEVKIDTTRPQSRRETRKEFSAWRDWGKVAAYIYTSTGTVFRFDGRMVLVEGKYMLKSDDDKHLPIEDILLSPEEFEPPIVELGLNFEQRGGGRPWMGYVK